MLLSWVSFIKWQWKLTEVERKAEISYKVPCWKWKTRVKELCDLIYSLFPKQKQLKPSEVPFLFERNACCCSHLCLGDTSPLSAPLQLQLQLLNENYPICSNLPVSVLSFKPSLFWSIFSHRNSSADFYHGPTFSSNSQFFWLSLVYPVKYFLYTCTPNACYPIMQQGHQSDFSINL